MLNSPSDLIAEQPVFAGTKSKSSTHAPLCAPSPILQHSASNDCLVVLNFKIFILTLGKKARKAQNNISSVASNTLAKAAFLCTVLLEEPDCHHLAFRVGLFGLEMPRPPASSKSLEVGGLNLSQSVDLT